MYRIPQLQKYKNLFHAFSQKSDGNMANYINESDYFFKDAVNNRKKFLKKVGVEMDRTICMWVMHRDEIVEASPKDAGISMLDYTKAVKVDGLITNKKGLFLFLLIADCLPIVIYDPVIEALALIHAGWKGVDLEITKKAVRKFKFKYRSKAENLIVGIGPCVYKESFVKDNPYQKDDPRWKRFMTPATSCHPERLEGVEGSKKKEILRSAQNDNVYRVDLVGFTKMQIIDSGVLAENIFESGIDTTKDERFFSHVREGGLPISQQGRFACVVGLK